MPAEAFEPELKCFFCKQPADRIGYYKKKYPGGGVAIENPQLCCLSCLKSHTHQIHQHRGGEEEVTSLAFWMLPKITKQRLGWLLSRKGKEVNHLASPYWKKVIWRMYYLHLPQREAKA